MKNAIITGAYGSIGSAIAGNIAQAGFQVCLVGRNRERLQETASLLKRQTGNQDIFYKCVDLASFRDIKDFAGNWKEPLSLLINNAATAPRTRTLSSEGIEMQFAVNILGYFRMTDMFSGFMKTSDDPRVINVASYWAGGLNMDDPEFKTRPYDNDIAYRQSKQADRMLTVAFGIRLLGDGITVNSCHPGDVNSRLSNDLGFGGSESPEKGAETPSWLALNPTVKGISGRYFANCREQGCEFSRDKSTIEQLFNLCRSFNLAI